MGAKSSIIMLPGLCLLVLPQWALSQTAPGSPPVRYQAQYTRIYFDDFETLAPSLGQGFVLGPAGSITSTPAEVISGKRSIKGSYSGPDSYTLYLQTDPAAIPLSPNHSYRVTFKYQVINAGGGFQVRFQTAAGGQAGSPLGIGIPGSAGAAGTATLTSALGPYNDYRLLWMINSTGAIVIDDIQISDVANGAGVASEDAEQDAPIAGPGLQLLYGSSVTTDPKLVIGGKASLRLSNNETVSTNPASLPLSGNTTYIVEFQYHVLNYGGGNTELYLYLHPAGIPYQSALAVQVESPSVIDGASGTFSSGAQTAGAGSYTFNIGATGQSDVVVDNIGLYRQDANPTGVPPPAWSNLATLPYPRLGKYLNEPIEAAALYPGAGEAPTSLDRVESLLAFDDVIVGVGMLTQTEQPDSIRRIRQMNPNVVILPYRAPWEESPGWPAPAGANIDLDYQFLQGIPDSWYVRDSKGNYVPDKDYPFIRQMNISSFSPVVNGQTYVSYMLDWLKNAVFSSGIWDGIFFDDLFGRVNQHVVNAFDPALFDFDFNRNGIRDETIAAVSDMTRQAGLAALSQFRTTHGDLELIIGNTTDAAYAPYINGFFFECMNAAWGPPFQTSLSPASWRSEFDAYRLAEATSRIPRVNLVMGCGVQHISAPGQAYVTPTAEDLTMHRLTMATALLGNSPYGFDLHGALTSPRWYDEYTVDSGGNAVEDRSKKGYLGQALSDATELTGAGTVIFQEGFEGATIPASFSGSPTGAVSITHAAGQVIAGSGSLVVSNPDHTQVGKAVANTTPAMLQLTPPNTYLLTFDWRILETLDGMLSVNIFADGQSVDYSVAPGVVAGDSGTVRFPFTIPAAGNWTIQFAVSGGGGKVAIDNVGVTQGGVGLWRRDFENGFVLVNPFSQPHTFSASDVAGTLKRTGVHRIKGTQAPDINNGQPLTGDFTLGAFDGIILLADPIRWSAPIINGISNAAGGQPGVASGAFVSIYGTGFTPLAYDDWGKSIANGQLPAQLDGISVSIGGKPAYINAITPGQINVQAPELGNGTVQVIVTTPGGASLPFTVNSQVYSPAFFPWPGNQPVATHGDYSFAVKNGTFPGMATVPAKPGEIIVLWGTGFGPTNPAVPAGQEPAVQAPPTALPVSVTIGGVPVPVVVAVLSSYAADYQIAVQIPASMADGAYPIVASINGVQSPSNMVLSVQRSQ